VVLTFDFFLMFFFSLSLSLLLLLAAPLHAAALPTVTFEAPSEAQVGSSFVVRVLLSSETPVNAVEASLAYPTTLLELVSVDRAGSIFDFWREEPDVSVPGVVAFEAGARLAFTGAQGEVLVLEFRALGSGTASLSFEELSLYAADGHATLVEAVVVPTSFSVEPNLGHPMSTENMGHRMSQGVADVVAPEFAEVSVEKSPVDGARLLVFEVSDPEGGSGTASVEARERGLWPWWGPWRSVTTPVVVKDGVRVIELRAVDRAGNEARERVTVRGGASAGIFLIAAVGLLALAALAWVWKKWR
jgi:hypothetical protein